MSDEQVRKYALHVEDDKDFRDMLYRWLTRQGYDVIQASNLQDANGHILRRQYDLYISDGSFPLVHEGQEDITAGEKFYRSLRESRPDKFNFVFISSSTNLADLASQEGIIFMDKTSISRGDFLAYLESLR